MDERCGYCDETIRPHDGVHLIREEGEAGVLLCGRCSNEAMSEFMELDFEHPEFHPIRLQDCRGAEHTFEFRTHLLGEVLKIDALEVRDGEVQGYEFSVVGEVEADPMGLFMTLYHRIRTELGRKYLTDSEPLDIAETSVVRGRIEWDEEADTETPRLVIDGRAVSWSEMGRMMMAYEGWSFNLEMFDCDDLVNDAGPPISSES